MLLLGFSAGLPLLLIFGTLSLWLAESNVTRTTIGFFSLVGLTFSIKFFWAPFVDRTPIPFLTAKLGKRRSWMLIGQIGIALGLISIASLNPQTQLFYVAISAFFLAFSAATQDVALDAYRIEAVANELQGAMSANYQLGYRIGMIVAGAGALYLAEFFSWPAAYLVMASLTSIGVITVLLIREPDAQIVAGTVDREKTVARALGFASLGGNLRDALDWFSSAVVGPFVDFFGRLGWIALLILLFVGAYRISDVTLGIMSNVFYGDMGFSKREIADIAKVYGVILTIIGAFVSGYFVSWFGIMRPLLAGAILVAATNLVFAYLAVVLPTIEEHQVRLLYLAMTISADNFSGGFAGTALIAYMSGLTNKAYTATQYALLSSFVLLPGKLLGSISGVIIDAANYETFFLFASAMGIPAILLTMALMRWGPDTNADGEGSADGVALVGS